MATTSVKLNMTEKWKKNVFQMITSSNVSKSDDHKMEKQNRHYKLVKSIVHLFCLKKEMDMIL